jgi:serine/threonine protein kinase
MQSCLLFVVKVCRWCVLTTSAFTRAQGQELFDALLEKKHYTEATARSIIKRILSALVYLHKLGIVRCDCMGDEEEDDEEDEDWP